MLKSTILISLLLAICCNILVAQIPAPTEYGQYLSATYTSEKGDLPYRIMFPKNYKEGEKYPMVLFLHGAGERGNDNEIQLVHGSKLFQDSSVTYPAVVVFPQCPRDDFWASVEVERNEGNRRFIFSHDGEPTNPLANVMALFEEISNQPYIDTDRVYVTGLSMGGMGTFELLWRIPEKIAAAAPICGGGNPRTAVKMTDVPVWAFHGVKDDVVRPQFSRNMVEAIQKAGGNAKITLFPDANHNSWDPTFSDPDYLKWMFLKSKNSN